MYEHIKQRRIYGYASRDLYGERPEYAYISRGLCGNIMMSVFLECLSM